MLAPTGRDAALTCSLLERDGFACLTCKSLGELFRRYREEGAAALMIAEEVFVSAGLQELRALLAEQSAWSDIPLLIFTGTPAAAQRRPINAHVLSSLGNVTLLDRPLRPVTMLSAANAALRARRRQYDARRELFEQRRAVRERDQFLAMLGHELRNPLSAITMAMNLEGDATASKYRDIMRRQVGHLTRLVDDLLDVSRVTSGKVSLRRENIELGAVAQRCMNTLAPTFPHHRFVFSSAAGKKGLWIHADPVRLEQVINNLLNNAGKYTAPGGEISVAVSRIEGDAALEVRDSGVGIAPEMLGRVFELFTQVEGTLDRAKGGMGIGLTLVRSLVELHGGTVQASSAGLGRGSVFCVRFPLAKLPAQRGPGGSSRMLSSAGAVAPVAPRYDVLVIEDNEDSRLLLCAALSRRGHTVFSSVDGVRGVEAALDLRPKVLLVDIGLPGIDGYEVARRVRHGLGRAVYMIAITGYGQPEDRRRALEAGFDLHMTKPLDVAEIDRLLGRSGLASADCHAQ